MEVSPVDGTYHFNSQGNKVFRYRVEENTIWLQEKKSKLQWKCTISDSAELDKCQCSQEDDIKLSIQFVLSNLRVVLGCTNNPSYVDLTCGEKNTRELIFHLCIGHGDAVRNIRYRFVLEPIALERLDVVEARLQDLQEMVEGKEYTGERITWSLETEYNEFEFLRWKLLNTHWSNLIKVNRDTIEVVDNSYYTISVVYKSDKHYMPQEEDDSEDEGHEEPLLDFLKNDKSIRKSYQTRIEGETLHLLEMTLFLKEGDQLKFRNVSQVYIPKGTKLLIHLLR